MDIEWQQQLMQMQQLSNFLHFKSLHSLNDFITERRNTLISNGEERAWTREVRF